MQREIISSDVLIDICQSEINQSLETFTNCSDVQASAITALASVYNLSNMLDDRLCAEGGISFFCNAITVLCDNGSGSTMLNKQCIQVRDNYCAVEWRIIGNLLLNGSIPNCSSFNNESNLTFAAAPTQTCPNGFDIFCNSLCLPVCGDLAILQYNDAVTDSYTIWSIIMFIISTTGGMIAFITFYFKRKTMYVCKFIMHDTKGYCCYSLGLK